MKSFKFELESLLRLRINIEKKKQADVALVSSKYNKEQLGKEGCLEKIKDSSVYVDNIEDQDEMINTMMKVSDYVVSLKAQINNHEESMQKISVELREKQRILVDASRDRRAVEILKEKKFALHKKETLKEEQKMLDEWKNEFKEFVL